MKTRRSGFTLVELLVVLMIGGIVMTAVYKTLLTQERSIRQSYAIIGTQSNVRTTVQVMGAEIFQLMLRIASGEKTKSELLGLGDHEFVPWNIGIVS